MKHIGVLKGHKDEIKTLYVANNRLFSAGKGNSTACGLYVWDLRTLKYIFFNIIY